LRAHGHGFGFGETAFGGSLALGLATLAALRLVPEILVMEERLFSRCKYEIRAAVYALEDAILKLRHACSPLINWSKLPGWRRPFRPRPHLYPRVMLLFDFPAGLLPVSFTSQRLLDPELLTRLEVEGVTLHFLNNVLLLDFALKAAKGVL
jgi:hypothetical protein